MGRGVATILALLLAGCASAPSGGGAAGPFADTRLQYALVAGDGAVLADEFGMGPAPSWAERAAAGGVLPFTAVMEAVSYPFNHALRSWAPGPAGPSENR